ncbi:MAG: hypothetical protein MSG64_09050 [Pyrinomonadaceae bacterium MAG19_C2-C3]|nr:hypothetical protein [Pyrinomonadaceae bacterium MAG19_C2-C3]
MSEENTKILPGEHDVLAQLVIEVRGMNAHMQHFDERLQSVEDKFDVRARETRPMSERIDQLLSEVAATRQEVREVNRTMRRMNADLATALRNHDHMEDRIFKLEEATGKS